MDLVKELRRNPHECSENDNLAYYNCRCSLTQRAADAIEQRDGEIGWLKSEKDAQAHEIELQAEVIEKQVEVISRLQDERPAYPGAWAASIEELEKRNRYQRETIGGYAEENEELRVEVGRLEERLRDYVEIYERQQDRVAELIDESNSQFDEIVGALEEFRGISRWAAAVADRLDR